MRAPSTSFDTPSSLMPLSSVKHDVVLTPPRAHEDLVTALLERLFAMT